MHVSVAVKGSSSVIRKSHQQPSSPASSPFMHWNSPRDKDSSCFECLRTGDECKPASSRRGGNFSHLRRTKRSKPASIAVTSPANPGSSDSWHGVEDGDVDTSHAQEPTYAELKNPYDALQILANISTTKDSTPIELTSPNEVDSSGYMGLGRSGKHPTNPLLPLPLPKSETERLVDEGLGALPALQLLRL